VDILDEGRNEAHRSRHEQGTCGSLHEDKDEDHEKSRPPAKEECGQHRLGGKAHGVRTQQRQATRDSVGDDSTRQQEDQLGDGIGGEHKPEVAR
jgi:hypothetical protein